MFHQSKHHMQHINQITSSIINSAIKVHSRIGPGLLESVYERILAQDLRDKGHFVEQQKLISFEYNKVVFENAFRVDLLIDNQVVVELKSVETLAQVHHKQILSYIRLMNIEVGLLVNFGEATLIEGLHRVANNYQEIV